jgi:hypothetical protein
MVILSMGGAIEVTGPRISLLGFGQEERISLRREFQDRGYGFHLASSKEELRLLLGTDPPDALLLDLRPDPFFRWLLPCLPEDHFVARILFSGEQRADVPSSLGEVQQLSGLFDASALASSATRTVNCPSNYDLFKSSSKYYCKKTTNTTTKNPTCSKHNMMNDWRWSSSNKKCYRTKNNGDKVYSTSNIECSSGYSYKASSGKCQKSGSTYYSTPTY